MPDKTENLNHPIDFGENDNEIILLENAEFEIQVNEKTYPGEGKIYFTWLPRPNLKFEIKNVSIPRENFHNDNITGERTLTILQLNCQYSVFVSNISLSPGRDSIIKGFVSGPIKTNTKKRVTEVIFWLPNFVDFYAPEIPLQAEEFEIKIAALERSHSCKIYEKLKELGGYKNTHLVKVRKRNARSFSYKELIEMQGILRYFLSFSRGMWTGLILPSEKKENMQLLSDILSVPPINPWEKFLSWFDGHLPRSIMDIFPEFVKKWRDEIWGETFQLVIYWYIMSNTRQGGLEGAIIMGQSALELISWTYLVNERKMLSVSGFKNLNAADCIRILLSTLEIPIDIPQGLENLLKLSKEKQWIDEPHSTCMIRNDIIHPEKKHEAASNIDIQKDAWLLTVWYVEISLLKILNYNGQYANRLRAEKIEPVPWGMENQGTENSL